MQEVLVKEIDVMRLLIPITIHSTEIPAIVDTAAQVSVINKDLIDKIGLQPAVESRVLLKGVSQNGHLNIQSGFHQSN